MNFLNFLYLFFECSQYTKKKSFSKKILDNSLVT